MIEQLKNKLLLGDAKVVLKQVPDGSVHLVVTSPPYNVGIEYRNADDRKPYADYLTFLGDVFTECWRVLVPGGKIAVNCPSTILQSSYSRMAYLSLDICLLLRKIGFLDREWITWIKMPKGELLSNSTAWGSWMSPSCPYLRDASEFIIIMDKGSHNRSDKSGHNDITSEDFLKLTSNCWYFPPEHDRNHPAPFPVELPMRLIKLYTWPEEVILDPFVGSGTTAFAAKELKRFYIGIDNSPKYIDMATRRLGQSKLWT